MTKKEREKFYLSALLRALSLELKAHDFKDWETPDFLHRSDDRILGVELTTFHLPPRDGEIPHQEQQSLKNRAVALAEKYHSQAGGPALYVSIQFNPHHPLTKGRIRSLSREIAESVLDSAAPASITDPVVEVPWGRRPKEIAGIRIHSSINGRDKLWQPDAGGWVAQIQHDQIAEVISSKALTEPTARKSCDDLWLVIVNDELGLSAPVEISSSAREAVYECPFDRVLWLRPYVPLVIELHYKRPTA